MSTRTTDTNAPPGGKAVVHPALHSNAKPSGIAVDALEDIQALVRFGHGGLRDSAFLLLCVKDASSAGRWLASVDISSASALTPPPARALQLAFTNDGLRALKLPDTLVAQFSDEFVDGMAGDESRSRRLGDTGDNAPNQWQWGSTECRPVHALLMLYARVGELEAYRDSILDADFGSAFEVVQTLPTDTLQTSEPFGFADGISQPRIDWDGTQRTDTHARDGYSNLLATGEVVLGYPNEYGQLTRRPLLDLDRFATSLPLPAASDEPGRLDFGANGCYLVLRQLEQDVDGFRQFIADRQDAGPPRRTDSRARLAAAMVGRQRDGTPLVSPSISTIPGIRSGDSKNQFNYDDDPDGILCPLGAHVRRANPRSGDLPSGLDGSFARLMARLGFGRSHKDGLDARDMVASSRFHRLLRRGRAYGPPLDSGETFEAQASVPEHGLQFICLVGNILRQFEFVQNAWMSGTAFAGTRPQSDPLLGTRDARLDGTPTDVFRRPDARGAAEVTEALPRFVRVRGGAYFFLPGIAAVRFIGAVAQSTPVMQGDRSP